MAHNKAEIYSTGSWTIKAVYPFHSFISRFGLISFLDYFLLFGGDTHYSTTDVIAKFDPVLNTWTRMGSLKSKRTFSAVIEVEKKLMIIGGYGKELTESCELLGQKIECNSREPAIERVRYPAVMVVNLDFTDNCKL